MQFIARGDEGDELPNHEGMAEIKRLTSLYTSSLGQATSPEDLLF